MVATSGSRYYSEVREKTSVDEVHLSSFVGHQLANSAKFLGTARRSVLEDIFYEPQRPRLLRTTIMIHLSDPFEQMTRRKE